MVTAVSQENLGPSAGSVVVERGFTPIPETPTAELDRLVARLGERSREFARLPIPRKIELLEALTEGTRRVAAEWVAAACRAKGLSLDAPVSGEEWIAGPVVTLRNLRLLARALRDIQRSGKPFLPPDGIRELAHGAVGVRVTPYEAYDKALYGGVHAETWLQGGVRRADVTGHQASFYSQREPEGGVSLVLGAGNVSSIPPMDVLQKSFVEGRVCILKMNPVNEYLGPILERAFQALVERGYLAIVYGGAAVGSHLCYHPGVADVHITGSDKTHDLIVWGPPGPERDDRKRRRAPLLDKPITSELGNVSPVLIVPGPYSEAELDSMAENVAGMVTNNASFNCNAAKLLVLPPSWPHRDAFLGRIARVLEATPTRRAYYPGAFDRYRSLTDAHTEVRRLGAAGPDSLPWTLVLGLDAANAGERNFCTEPFCGILNETSIGSNDPAEFLAAAVPFANDRVWGTLSAAMFVHPSTEADRSMRRALDGALAELRYGTVAINCWPAFAYALGTTPWGGHPSATLEDIQSGLGWVHNTVMLEQIEKCVIRSPLRPPAKHIYAPSHRTVHQLGRRLVDFEAAPSWLAVPGLALTALRG